MFGNARFSRSTNRDRAWAPISLDPGATWLEVLKWLVYAAAFTLALSVSSRRGADWGIELVFWSGVVLALVTVGHGVAGDEGVRPLRTSFRGRPVAPFSAPQSQQPCRLSEPGGNVWSWDSFGQKAHPPAVGNRPRRSAHHRGRCDLRLPWGWCCFFVSVGSRRSRFWSANRPCNARRARMTLRRALRSHGS